MVMVFNESYGELSFAQNRAYKKYNVSPSDHDSLVDVFGADAHNVITHYVVSNAEENGGMFSVYSLYRDN